MILHDKRPNTHAPMRPHQIYTKNLSRWSMKMMASLRYWWYVCYPLPESCLLKFDQREIIRCETDARITRYKSILMRGWL